MMVKPAVKSGAPAGEESAGFVLRLRPVVGLTPDQLLELSGLNRDLRMELTAEGELIVMPPAGGGEQPTQRRGDETIGELGQAGRQR